MISCEKFFNFLQENNVRFFAGVPDSTLKNVCAYIDDNSEKENNIIAANEGNAVGIAAGYHLSTGNIPLVYCQNSGLGNMVNPLTSLASPEVYSLPMLLLVGWRGEPGIKDEPQHVEMGEVQNSLLESLNIPYEVISDDWGECQKSLFSAIGYAKDKNSPFALIVRKNTFDKHSLKLNNQSQYNLSREEMLKIVLENSNKSDIFVSTTGKTSRELFELREKLSQGHEQDFLTVGSMGHASSIALGIALQKKNRRIVCVDGDGASIMHMGSLAIIGQLQPKNLMHIIINNFSHESVGGAPTASSSMNISAIAKDCGYRHIYSVDTKEDLEKLFKSLAEENGPIVIEIKCKIGSRDDLGRPTTTPQENKKDFMKFLAE